MKPILFNTSMVRAILDGHKTVTRRVVKPRYKDDEGGFQVCTNKATGEWWVEKSDWNEGGFDIPRYIEPPYQIGDILWVREKTYGKPGGIDNQDLCYATHCHCGLSDEEHAKVIGWRPSIHMPKRATRIFLRVTDVRIERLQDITEEQVEAEGADVERYLEFYDWASNVAPPGSTIETMQEWFGRKVWNAPLNKTNYQLYGWDANPWVWVIKFKLVEVE